MPQNLFQLEDLDQTVESVSRLDKECNPMMRDIAVFMVSHQDAIDTMQFIIYRLGDYLRGRKVKIGIFQHVDGIDRDAE